MKETNYSAIHQIAVIKLLMLSFLGGKVSAVAQSFNAFPMAVIREDNLLLMPLTGGMNAPQFSQIDLNEDDRMDLFVFDRQGNVVLTFLNEGIQGEVQYRYAPQFASIFPKMNNFALLRDYNRDGLMDVFTHSTVPGIFGIEVYKGVKEEGNLGFEKVDFPEGEVDIIFYRQTNGNFTNLYVSNIDLPAIEDVDGDGDLDVLTFSIAGGYLEYFQNQSVEEGFGTDSLKFILKDNCWGKFFESGFSEVITLSSSAGVCANGLSGSVAEVRHAGSTVLAFDQDKDGDLEVALGDVSFANLNLLTNGGTPAEAFIISQDTFFPSYNRPVNLSIFPAGYYLDVDNDGRQDLLVSPNSVNGENREVVWYYQNVAAQGADSFRLVQKNFLVEEMIDLGSNAHPSFVDYNADGLTDLVVGSGGFFLPGGRRDARLFLFENTGTAEAPAYRLVDENYLDFQRFSETSFNFAPTFGDLDNDGDLDLLVGENTGTLFFAENLAGAGRKLQFAPVVAGYMGIDVGQESRPQIFDWNKDGLQDLIIGERNGNVNFFPNTGTAEAPSFVADPAEEPNDDFFGHINTQAVNAFTGHSAPYVLSLGDSILFFSGTEAGNIIQYQYFEPTSGRFERLNSDVGNIRAGERTNLAIADLDNDGLMEMVVGNSRGGLSSFKTDIPNDEIVPALNPVEKTAVQIYPNPVRDHLSIELAREGYLSIYNSLGQLIVEKPYSGRKHQVPVQDWLPGIYLILIRMEEVVETHKIIKY